jgi:hypothetical protein
MYCRSIIPYGYGLHGRNKSLYHCQGSTANPTLIGSTCGSYGATPGGLSINAATGALNLALSTPGIYTVTYTLAVGCQPTASTQVTINAQVSVNPVPNRVYCNGIVTSPVSFSGSAASYSWINDNVSIGVLQQAALATCLLSLQSTPVLVCSMLMCV